MSKPGNLKSDYSKPGDLRPVYKNSEYSKPHKLQYHRRLSKSLDTNLNSSSDQNSLTKNTPLTNSQNDWKSNTKPSIPKKPKNISEAACTKKNNSVAKLSEMFENNISSSSSCSSPSISNRSLARFEVDERTTPRPFYGRNFNR